MTLPRRFGTWVLLFFCLIASGCVYYNTFYNARKKYEEADRKRLEAEANPGDARVQTAYQHLYIAAITKASMVLDRYSKSKWVDDSLLLIGKAFYWREDYDEALTKFRELQENFPQSELILESRYWQGLSFRARGQVEEARKALQEVGDADDSQFSGNARLALAEMEAETENYEGAVRAYRTLLDQMGKSDLRARVWKGIGNAFFSLEQYEEALDAYRKVLSSRPTSQVNFDTRVQMGATLELQGKLEEALETYGAILKIKRLRIYESQVRLKEANACLLIGHVDRALEIYLGVIKEHRRTDYSAEAYYRMGLIELKQRKDLKQAKAFFDSTRREKGSSEAAGMARELEKSLTDLEKYKKASEKEGKKGLDALFNVAELYLFKLSESDSALAAYRRVLEVGDTTEYAPKALYAIGLIYADSLGNASEAREVFRRLIDTYPQTPYAISARERIQHSRTDDALAEARFLEAEALKDEGAREVDVLTIFRQVADEYPHSLYAPKALYALAWTYENEFAELDTAREHYRTLVERYPMTAFAEVARQKLEGGFLDPPKEEVDSARADSTASEAPADTMAVPSEVPSDTMAVASADTVAAAAEAGDSTQVDTATGSSKTDAPADSAAVVEDTAPKPEAKTSVAPPLPPLTFDEVEEKPELIAAEPFEYPEEALEEGVAGTVVVKVLIGKNGQVKSVETIGGPELLQETAVEAVYQYRFRPGIHKGEPREVLMEISIPFKRPE